MIKYKDKEFNSILQLSKYLNTPDSAIARYYRNSISQQDFEGKIDNLLETKKGKKEALDLVNNKYGTEFRGTTQAYKFLVKNYNLRTSFLVKPDGILEYQYIKLFYKIWGTEIDWILRKDEKPIHYNGMNFKDLRNFLIYYKVTLPKFIKSLYLREGDLKLALLDNTDETYSKIYKPVVKGRQFSSVAELSRYYALNEIIYKRLIRQGYTDDEAYEIMVEGKTLQNIYFPLETTVGTFHTVDDLMHSLGITLTKVRTMLENNTVEKNIILKKQGFDITNYIDRETDSTFPLKYRGTWLSSGNQFLEYFGLDGRKSVFYKGIFSSKEKFKEYIKWLESIEVIWCGESHFTLKSLHESINKEYTIHYKITLIIWDYLCKTTMTPLLKHDYINKNIDSMKEKSKMFNIDGKSYKNMEDIAEKYNYTQTTVKKFIVESKTYEEFYKKIRRRV